MSCDRRRADFSCDIEYLWVTTGSMWLRSIFLYIVLFSRCYGNEVSDFMEEYSVPGLAVAICESGDLSIRCYGVKDRATHAPITPHTLFKIASITKVFTATDLALEVALGHMSLDEPVTHFLPECQNGGSINRVTLQELATHTSSLPRGLPLYYNRRHVIAFLNEWEPIYPIGTHYLYSNLAFGVLGYAEEFEEHASLEALFRREIFTPLGMKESYINVPQVMEPLLAVGYASNGKAVLSRPNSAWPAGGALKSTISDMSKFLQANLKLLGPKSLQDAMQFAQAPYFPVNKHFTMGLGWERFTTPEGVLIIDKNGSLSGFASYIGMVPSKKIGIVLLANKSSINITKFGRKLLLKHALITPKNR